jgi:2-polyprenyl-3-methyl-5-hydroxy-6-metoxy-1,4-benzoquinol methylase/HEAT repeat protein
MASQENYHERLNSKSQDEIIRALRDLKFDFEHVPDKTKIQDDLHKLIDRDNDEIKREIINIFKYRFSLIVDKETAWSNLLKLTKNESKDVKEDAIEAIGDVIPYVEGIEGKWDNFYQLILDIDTRNSAFRALRKLRPDFRQILEIPNIWNNLWEVMHKSAYEKNNNLRFSVSELIGLLFQYMPDKEQAWKDLLKLSRDADSFVRQIAPQALGWSYKDLPIELKKAALDDIFKLIQMKDWETRFAATIAIGDVFESVPDRIKTYDIIQQQRFDENPHVRRAAAISLRNAFPFIENKNQALDDLLSLTKDEDLNVMKWAKEAIEAIYKENKIEYLSETDILLADIFKSRYLKERKGYKSETNSKTLKLLKGKIISLLKTQTEIKWLDVGCGDGRCIEILDFDDDTKELGKQLYNINYIGLDIDDANIETAKKLAEKYNIQKEFIKSKAIDIKYDSKFDVISAILLLHEIDPLQLPYVLKNMLIAVKEGGVILISDFNETYEQERDIVVWTYNDINYILKNIGGIVIRQELMRSEENPAEYGFYRCCIKRVGIDAEIQSRFFDNYDNFLKSKVSELAKQYRKLGVILEKRVKEILSRPDIDFRSVTGEERGKIESNLNHQDVKIFRRKQLLLEQILLLNEKINQFEIKINPAKVESQFRAMLKSSIITEDEYKMVKQMLSRIPGF